MDGICLRGNPCRNPSLTPNLKGTYDRQVQAITGVPALLFQTKLLTLSGVDLAIIILYFLAVLGIGFYLKRFTKTGEDFFLAGREMTAWMLNGPWKLASTS